MKLKRCRWNHPKPGLIHYRAKMMKLQACSSAKMADSNLGGKIWAGIMSHRRYTYNIVTRPGCSHICYYVLIKWCCVSTIFPHQDAMRNVVSTLLKLQSTSAKGQIISKANSTVFIWTKSERNIFSFLPWRYFRGFESHSNPPDLNRVNTFTK